MGYYTVGRAEEALFGVVLTDPGPDGGPPAIDAEATKSAPVGMSERSRNNRGRGGPRRQSRFPVNTPPVDVTIDRIGGQGDGVARAIVGVIGRPRERQIFVPFTLPGERVLAGPVRDKGEGVACEPTELASTSSERADPPSPAFHDLRRLRYNTGKHLRIKRGSAAA